LQRVHCTVIAVETAANIVDEDSGGVVNHDNSTTGNEFGQVNPVKCFACSSDDVFLIASMSAAVSLAEQVWS
jgi:hypothetical protein